MTLLMHLSDFLLTFLKGLQSDSLLMFQIFLMQGGCAICDMGVVGVCFPCFLSSFFVLQVHEDCSFINMSYDIHSSVHENY